MAFAALTVDPAVERVPRRPWTSDQLARVELRARSVTVLDRADTDAAAASFRPAYVGRLQEIRRLQEAHRACLARAYARLEARLGHDRDALLREWRAVAGSWSFARVNRLIAEHNERYPVERNLPFDPAAGDYAPIGGRPYRRPLLDAQWVLDRFPVDVTA